MKGFAISVYVQNFCILPLIFPIAVLLKPRALRDVNIFSREILFASAFVNILHRTSSQTKSGNETSVQQIGSTWRPPAMILGLVGGRT